MPRPYRRGQRQAATDETRTRILAAARELLTAEEHLASFSIDAVAQRADVARMTVYYQFGSRTGLLEALFDDLAARGGMEQLPSAFQQPDPLAALAAYIGIFGSFYSAHRLIHRRLRGLSILDPELEKALQARGERRRSGLSVLVQRLAAQSGRPVALSLDEAIDVLHMLTSFETFDALAGTARSSADVIPLVQRLVSGVLCLDVPASTAAPPVAKEGVCRNDLL